MDQEISSSGLSKVPTYDVGAQHIAAVYAQAFLRAAESAGRTAALVEELDSVVADVLDGFPELEATLASHRVTHEERVAILDRVFGSLASPLVLDFLKVLSAHDRLDCLRAVQGAVDDRYDVLRGRVRVVVTTAAEIDGALAGRITERLRGMLGGEPMLECEIDPALIGGLVLRIGDTLYDGSVAMQLDRVREEMINRSVHEIQSRRDRFRHSAGN
jgi:F-type H+-transporting ATPase subunit delta